MTERSKDLRPWGSLNWPNRISLMRLLLVAPFIVLLMNMNDPAWPHARHGAVLIFLVLVVSDVVDGALARRLNQRTRLGAILDPLADKTLIICSVVLLSVPESAVPGARVPNWVVVAVVGKDFWTTVGFVVVYLATDRFRVQPTVWGKASTFAQAVMVLTVLLSPDVNWLIDGAGSLAAAVTQWAVIAICAAAVVSYTKQGLGFVAASGKPLDENGKPQAKEE